MPATSVISRVKAFREQLSRRVLVADGAMGTMLYDKGIFINRCYDELNLASPDMIRQIHLDYAKAGAEILETNTFGANRMRLADSVKSFARSTRPASKSRGKRAAIPLLWLAPWVRWGPTSSRWVQPLSPKRAQSSAS